MGPSPMMMELESTALPFRWAVTDNSTTNMGHYEITVLVLFAQFRCSPDGGLLLVEHVHVAGAVDIVKTGDPGHILEFIRVWGIEQQGGAAEFFRKGLRQLAA